MESKLDGIRLFSAESEFSADFSADFFPRKVNFPRIFPQHISGKQIFKTFSLGKIEILPHFLDKKFRGILTRIFRTKKMYQKSAPELGRPRERPLKMRSLMCGWEYLKIVLDIYNTEIK
jgi:hypothetical protein